MSDLDNMHKVVLEAPGESDLIKMSEKLKENGVDFKLWIEQPENFPTCLAVKPYPKEVFNMIKTFSFTFAQNFNFRRFKSILKNTNFTKDLS